jgi:uncharacterized SAM-binding protein YcdF (DUF218 family)
MKKWFQKYKWWLIGIPSFFLIVFLLRFQLLLMLGNFLIREDDLQNADVIYVLGGNSKDRGEGAANLFHQKYSDTIVCIGGNNHHELEYLNIFMTESEVTARVIEGNNVPKENIRLIKESTSTQEEFLEIVKDINAHNYKRIIIVTDKFHTRRVQRIFRKELEKLGCELFVVGVSNHRFDEQFWWDYELGSIYVNNEYMKLLYYFLKY